jgi:hypothetical protein
MAFVENNTGIQGSLAEPYMAHKVYDSWPGSTPPVPNTEYSVSITYPSKDATYSCLLLKTVSGWELSYLGVED